MKGLVIIALLCALGAICLWVSMSQEADRTITIPLACGNPQDGSVEIQIAVSMVMVHKDPPRSNDAGILLWDRWIAEHFRLCDEGGTLVPLKRHHFANLIPEARVGTPDSYLVTTLRTGAEYTLDCVPILAEGKRYRYTFAVPADGS